MWRNNIGSGINVQLTKFNAISVLRKNTLLDTVLRKKQSRANDSSGTETKLTNQSEEQVRSTEEFSRDTTLVVNVISIASNHIEDIVNHNLSCHTLLNRRRFVEEKGNQTSGMDWNT